jgi:hypothetical protein
LNCGYIDDCSAVWSLRIDRATLVAGLSEDRVARRAASHELYRCRSRPRQAKFEAGAQLSRGAAVVGECKEDPLVLHLTCADPL